MSEKFLRGTINPKQTKQTEEFKLLKGEMKWAPKVEVNVGDKFDLVNFRPTVTIQSELFSSHKHV